MQEIALHVLDLVQNSLEAGANRVEIDIREDLEQDILVVRIADNGRGMDEKTLQQVTNPFYTTRTTRKVGLGISLLKAAAEQAGGSLGLESCPGEGTTVTATFQHSHWDRAPLGDMATTLMVVLAANPRLDLIYRHAVNGAVFEFVAAEARQRLGDLPLNHPGVLQWLKDYWQQSIKNLYGGDS